MPSRKAKPEIIETTSREPTLEEMLESFDPIRHGGEAMAFKRAGREVLSRQMVKHIFIAQARGAPMKSIGAVDAVAGEGLAGDRYCNRATRRGPDYQVSLIEAEAIEAFTREFGLTMSEDMPRRNIVTSGIRLNELVGKQFLVGGALLEGLELCEPCSLFAKRTYAQVIPFFNGRGGLRARILRGGTIRAGDAVTISSAA